MKTNFFPTSTTASSSTNAALLASPNPQNYAIPHVESIFNALADNGTLGTTPGGAGAPNPLNGKSHIQGMAFYTNANGSFILLSHNDFSHECGKLIVLDVNGNSTQLYDSNPATSNEPYFNHPSGIQVVGDFLVFPVANSDSSASHVDFYNLTQVGSADNPGPQLLSNLRIYRDGSNGSTATDSAAAGMTYANGCYYVAVYGKGIVDIYQSNAVTSLSDANLMWQAPQNISVDSGFDCLNLLTDTSNNVYLIGFAGITVGAEDLPITFNDYAYLYQISNNGDKLELNTLSVRHMYTETIPLEPGALSCHFRWGSGIQTFADGSLSLYCSARNFLPDSSAGLELQWNQWNQISGWQWSSDLGQPSTGGTIFGKTTPSVSIAKAAGTTVADGKANVLVVGSDGNLWTCFVSSNGWQWSCLGQPGGGISVKLPLGTVYSGGASNVLVVGSDGNAYTCFTDGDGGNWQWSGSLGQPGGGITIQKALGTVLSDNSPNVLVVGSDGNLYSLYVGENWQWSSSLGQPTASVSITAAAGTTVADGKANVLVVGSDGNLWTCFVSSNGWQWSSSLGQPSGGLSVKLPLGTVYSGGASNVLVVGSDGNAYTCFTDEDGGNWQWSGSLGQPEGVDITSPMGTVVSNNEANVLILGSDGNLWTCFVGSNGWQWGNLYNPSYRPNSGAVTDENTGPQIQLSLGTVLSGSSPNIAVTGPNGTLVTCYISN